MRMTTSMAAVLLVLATVLVTNPTPTSAGLDCARVKELKQQGTSAVEIARTLGLTTPDVQACLAGVVEEPQMANPAGKLPLAPQRPVADGPIRRAPDGQNE
jgi:hypothetical protein